MVCLENLDEWRDNMGDGATCHECRMHKCICLTPYGVKILRALLLMTKRYNNCSPEVGFYPTREQDLARETLKLVGVEVSHYDMKQAIKLNGGLE